MARLMVSEARRGLGVVRARPRRAGAARPDRRLWEALRDQRLGGVRFRRQQPVGPFILDFFAPSLRLAVVVEADGPRHGRFVDYGLRRQAEIEDFGIRFVRLPADAVVHDLPACLRQVAEAVRTIRDLS